MKEASLVCVYRTATNAVTIVNKTRKRIITNPIIVQANLRKQFNNK
jgi:hypothetical protein